MPLPNDLAILPLIDVPQHRRAVASLIHHEFWTDVPGASVAWMEGRLAEHTSIDAMPISLVALIRRDTGDEVVGAVNLIHSDNDDRPDWHPWLAGMVVAEAWRGQGIGSALVRELLAHAKRLGITRVWFGTDGPGFYTRLGAQQHEQPRPGFWFMRFEL